MYTQTFIGVAFMQSRLVFYAQKGFQKLFLLKYSGFIVSRFCSVLDYFLLEPVMSAPLLTLIAAIGPTPGVLIASRHYVDG